MMNLCQTRSQPVPFETGNVKICGLVTTTEGIVFNLNCLFCSEVSDDYIEFIAHINTNHLSNLQELKNCIDDQFCNLTEIKFSRPEYADYDQNILENNSENDVMSDPTAFPKQDLDLTEDQETTQIKNESFSSENEEYDNEGENKYNEDMPTFEIFKIQADQKNDIVIKNTVRLNENVKNLVMKVGDRISLAEDERKKIEYLINLYKKFPILWDFRTKGYNNEKLKEEAFTKISDDMSRNFKDRITSQTVKEIISDLSSQLKCQIQSNCEATSKLWFHEMLSFILIEDAKEIEYLIDLYKKHPILWNSKLSGYNNSTLKNNAYIEMAQAMTEKFGHKQTAHKIKQNILSLCCQFKRELQDMSRTGKETPSLWFFDRLSFISKQKSRKERLSSTKETDYLIDLYKQYPILWDHRMYDTKYAVARNKAFEEMSEAMKEKFKDKLVTTNVRLKITQLRSSFYLELHDMLKSQRSTPRLKVFDQLSFIMLGDMDSINKFDEENDQNLVSCSQVIDISSLLQFQKDKDLNSDFIELYKSMPCLWNKQSPDYENEEQCQKAFDFLMKTIKEKWEIHLSEEEILQKISIMKFLNNTIKINNKSECSEDGLQEPWYYDKLDFLEKKKRGNRNHQHKCEICPEIFVSQIKLQNHLHSEHNVNMFVCKICTKVFQSIHLLKLHEKIHVNFENRPFACQFCDAKFVVKSSLAEHERRHTKTFLHQCEICSKKFISRSEIIVHMRTHTGEKPYLCHQCGQSFQMSSTLAVHRRSHTGDRPYKCTLCPMAFFRNSTLKRHLISHTNIRDHVCNVCGKGFKFRSTLQQHALLHSKEKKYSCKICMKRFSQYGGLHGHMKTHGIAPVEVSENMFVNELGIIEEK